MKSFLLGIVSGIVGVVAIAAIGFYFLFAKPNTDESSTSIGAMGSSPLQGPGTATSDEAVLRLRVKINLPPYFKKTLGQTPLNASLRARAMGEGFPGDPPYSFLDLGARSLPGTFTFTIPTKNLQLRDFKTYPKQLYSLKFSFCMLPGRCEPEPGRHDATVVLPLTAAMVDANSEIDLGSVFVNRQYKEKKGECGPSKELGGVLIPTQAAKDKLKGKKAFVIVVSNFFATKDGLPTWDGSKVPASSRLLYSSELDVTKEKVAFKFSANQKGIDTVPNTLSPFVLVCEPAENLESCWARITNGSLLASRYKHFEGAMRGIGEGYTFLGCDLNRQFFYHPFKPFDFAVPLTSVLGTPEEIIEFSYY